MEISFLVLRVFTLQWPYGSGRFGRNPNFFLNTSVESSRESDLMVKWKKYSVLTFTILMTQYFGGRGDHCEN